MTIIRRDIERTPKYIFPSKLRFSEQTNYLSSKIIEFYQFFDHFGLIPHLLGRKY